MVYLTTEQAAEIAACHFYPGEEIEMTPTEFRADRNTWFDLLEVIRASGMEGAASIRKAPGTRLLARLKGNVMVDDTLQVTAAWLSAGIDGAVILVEVRHLTETGHELMLAGEAPDADSAEALVRFIQRQLNQ